jgi:hypothetical protein
MDYEEQVEGQAGGLRRFALGASLFLVPPTQATWNPFPDRTRDPRAKTVDLNGINVHVSWCR